MKIIDFKGAEYQYDHRIKCPLPDREILAKQSDIFYVMSTSHGDLFNPHETGSNIYKRDRSRGKFKYNLEKCSESCYNFYVRFLKDMDKRYLRIAQRRFIDEM